MLTVHFPDRFDQIHLKLYAATDSGPGRQWTQLGIRASASKKPQDGWMIDLEALWLLTASAEREDARLFDLCMDWLSVNASFANIPHADQPTAPIPLFKRSGVECLA